MSYWLQIWMNDDDGDSKWPKPIVPNPRRRYSDSWEARIHAAFMWLVTHGLAALAGALYLAPFVWQHGCH